MKKIGIFYGSSTGNTEVIADKIQQMFGEEHADVFNIDAVEKSEIEPYQYLIFGTSTWGLGDMQDDWEEFMDELKTIDLSKKKVALFGLGDQEVYSGSFVNGMGELFEQISKRTKIVGHWPIDDYDFVASKALKNGKFVGLAIDFDNGQKKVDEYIEKWVKQLKEEFKG
ncbi:MAG: flavodoxin [Bacteroidetes bacterium]|nr:flavodoxin [Bacteroidota bacterium]